MYSSQNASDMPLFRVLLLTVRAALIVYILICWPGLVAMQIMVLHGYGATEITPYFFCTSVVWIFTMNIAGYGESAFELVTEKLHFIF